MPAKNDQQDILQFVNKIGYHIGETVQYLELHYQKSFDFSPDMAMFLASYTVKKTFTRPTTAPKYIKNSICFFFRDVLNNNGPAITKRKSATQDEKPFIRVFPSTFSYTSLFKKGSHVKIVSVLISADYLKSFLKNDAEQFQFLFETRHDFLIEEIMTDDIARTVNDIVKKEEPGALRSYHYRLKAMELLFYLFQSLGKREKSPHRRLSEKDIASIYKVRDKLVSSLHKPSSIAALKQIAGMNELKMRKVFMQVFGMGIYDYYQHLRMKEAARLLRSEKLSVSEAGYQLGFENLSHFSRVFEKHIGKKPKKYSSEV
ncbi:AraC family transcriptional regulator [Niabella ginsenosidivorans]|uniref:AraC family transcriptional regulator n=1 Tax=Niabella ginsenosidivorans TaxID=1176587 RepID=A0A1A9I405_9BACT|nr:AraC family transcriptional regulator [Niabella ginsenosidivorans]ANH81440.1 AraC family transcriptional regulator [Niabella ginsenosidivorans]